MLGEYFGQGKMKYRFVRIPVDSCDFSLSHYEADGDEADASFESFSFARVEKYILPMLADAEAAYGGRLEIMLSPWSPPAYMKTNGERNHGGKLKVTYPIISKDIADGNLVGTYMVNPVKLGNGLGEKDEMAYIVAGIIEWPSLYNDENIEKLEYTAYNASCIFDYSDMSENKYTKKQMDIKGETKTIYGNDENKLKLIIINELPTSDN